MRILILHSRYRSGALSGENRVVADEATLLRNGGHHVEVFAPDPDETSRVGLAARSLGSSGTAKVVADRVRSEAFDIVHCHNMFPALGPGVLRAAEESGAAVVMTLHNYRLMCIAGTFFRRGKVCQDCLGRSPHPGVIHACYRSSRAESAVIAASLVAARSRGMLDSVHRFFAVSAFVREKHIEGGIAPERILVKPNVVGEQVRRRGAGSHFLILSRLSVEKGIAPIVNNWSSDLGELVIAGDGPELDKITKLAQGRGVRLLGAVAPAEIPLLLGDARAVLVPSTWYEGQPRTILEAYASGVPVIGSRIGGIDELIEDGATGVTVPLNDPDAWRAAASMLADDDVCVRLGDAAHACWVDRFSPARGLTTLEAGYHEALESRLART